MVVGVIGGSHGIMLVEGIVGLQGKLHAFGVGPAERDGIGQADVGGRVVCGLKTLRNSPELLVYVSRAQVSGIDVCMEPT